MLDASIFEDLDVASTIRVVNITQSQSRFSKINITNSVFRNIAFYANGGAISLEDYERATIASNQFQSIHQARTPLKGAGIFITGPASS